MKNKVLARLVGGGLLAVSAFFGGYTNAQTLIQNEYWISPSTNTLNLGTLTDPWDGSTADKFGQKLYDLPPNSTLHVLAGTYETHGTAYSGVGWNVKSGQKIIGSGIDVTIIRLKSGTPDNNWVFGTISGANSNIVVSDMTIDCNYNSGAYTYHGMLLRGKGHTIRNVKVKGLAKHTTSNSEAWGLVISPAPFADSTGNLIEGCEVSGFSGDVVSAISFNGGATNEISGIIRNNHLLFTQIAGQKVIAINGSWTHDILIEGNYVEGATVGYYGDTGTSSNGIVVHNTFKDCPHGVVLRGAFRQNLTFAYNNISLTNRADLGGIASGFSFLSDGTYDNMVIVGNRVSFRGAYSSGTQALDLENQTATLILNNYFDPDLSVALNNTQGYVFNNFNLDGSLYEKINQTIPANSIVRSTVLTSSYTAGISDSYIGIKRTAAVTVNLPSAAGCPGKELIIAKEVSNGNTITISPTAPEKINGSSSMSFSGSYGSRTIISDGTNWFWHAD